VDPVLAHPENGRGSALHFKQEGAECSAAAPHRIVLLPPAGQAAEAAAESIPLLLLWLLQEQLFALGSDIMENLNKGTIFQSRPGSIRFRSGDLDVRIQILSINMCCKRCFTLYFQRLATFRVIYSSVIAGSRTGSRNQRPELS
jgi:hypothetical protein